MFGSGEVLRKEIKKKIKENDFSHFLLYYRRY